MAPSRDVASGASYAPEADDARVVAALRRRDEAAFVALVARHQPLMLRVAGTFVRSAAVAEEVVQETWVGVLNGIDRFEARSSLKTWIFRILCNRAKTRGVRESRTVPMSALGDTDAGGDDGAVDPSCFLDADHPRWAGHWAAQPPAWDGLPERRLLHRETFDRVREAIVALPARQREVIVLRDVAGWEPEEVCAALEISAGNQRVLLHRARSQVRRALERYLDGEAD